VVEGGAGQRSPSSSRSCRLKPSWRVTALIRAGIHAAEVVAAATGDDEDNLVVSMLARFEFGVRRVVGRVNNPKNAWLYNPDMGVDVAIDQPDLMAKLIAEEMSLGDMLLLLKLRRGEYTLVEEKLSPGSQALGVAIKDMALPETCVIAAVIRQGKVLTPRGQMQFEAGDEVLAVVDNTSLATLRQLLAPNLGPKPKGS
jgi:trk system potassium uptake protein TrkA